MIPQADYQNYINSKLLQLTLVDEALKAAHIHFADELLLEMVISSDLLADRDVALARLAHRDIDNLLDDRRMMMAG